MVRIFPQSVYLFVDANAGHEQRENCAFSNTLKDTYHQIVSPDHVVLTILPRSYRYRESS